MPLNTNTDTTIVTVTSTKVIISQPSSSVSFNGTDIVSASIANAPPTPDLPGAMQPWVVKLLLTGSAREQFQQGEYMLNLDNVSTPSGWKGGQAGAAAALAAITPVIRSVPSGGGGGQVDTIVPGDGIDVDSTDPVNPIVKARVDGVTVGFNGLGQLQVPASGGGYVVGPGSAVDDDIALFDGTSGSLIKSAGINLTEVVESYPLGDVDLIHSSGASPIVLKRVNDGDGTSAQANTGSFQINVEAKNSVEVDAGEVQLVGDEASPGNNEYYGTNGSGTKGFHALPTDTGITQLTGDVTAGPGSGSQAATLASVITAGGPTGSATVSPIITYDAKGRLTTVSSATITPAIGSVTGLGTGVATALGNNADSASGFVTQSGGDARYTRIGFSPVTIPLFGATTANLTWTNMPAALTFFNGAARYTVPSDCTNRTQIQLHVLMAATGGSASAKLRLLYRTQAAGYTTPVSSWSTVGTAEVEVNISGANALFSSGWIDLAAGAKAPILITLAGIDGDGAADPIFQGVYVELK